ncbi:MAG: SpoIID/LytB domain-containing protein [Lachnospiraceae bacterium]|nr:SpoIID/LytB domain-containing protein [Lachnospiraceae bacterium]
MRKTEKTQIKIIICLMGIIILFVLAIAMLVKKPEEKPPVHIPVVTRLHNVWITEVTETSINVFDGTLQSYPMTESFKSQLDINMREQVADLLLLDGMVSRIKVKNREKLSGKVLRVLSGTGVEVEGHGILEFADNVKMYQLYNSLQTAKEKDIRVGYNFCDFVMEKGKICGVLVTRDEAMEYIRVQVKTSDYAKAFHESVNFTADTDFVLRYESAQGMVEEFHKAGEKVEISRESHLFENGRVYIEPEALTGKITLLSVDRSHGNPSYRGTMELVLGEEGIYVINELLLEEYLYAVVPSEMPSNYPIEALKAQAVCARTYAYGHMLKASSKLYGAHVDDSSSYQVYNNIMENEMTTTAVRETSGQLLYIPGQNGEELADTYYYSTSCGHGTETDIWKSSDPVILEYLPAKRIAKSISLTLGEEEQENLAYTAHSLMDEDVFYEFINQSFENDFEAKEPWYRWTYSVSRIDTERMLEVLQSRYKANSKLVLTRNKKGEFVSKPIEELEDVQEISVVSRNEGGIAEELLIETKDAVIKVITEYNIRSVLCDGETKVVRQDGSKVSMPTLLPSAFFVITTGKEDENVVGYIITGGGFGHGVGMSQNGARAMADYGMSAQNILQFFYESGNIKQIY